MASSRFSTERDERDNSEADAVFALLEKALPRSDSQRERLARAGTR